MSLILLGILNSQVSPAAGGAYDLLESTVLTSSAASVTFTGLGSYTDYKHLQIRAVAFGTGVSSGYSNVQVRFNSDSGTNYSVHWLGGTGSSVISSGDSSQTNITLYDWNARGGDGDNAGAAVIDILDFASVTKNKTLRSLHGGVVAAETKIYLQSGAWYNTNAITAIEMIGQSDSFATGSRFSLMGVK